jgi:hypothetical protein
MRKNSVICSYDIIFHFPDAWEGSSSAQTTSGDLSIKGNEVKIVEVDKGRRVKKVLTRKGADGDRESSLAEFATSSRDLKIFVGRS